MRARINEFYNKIRQLDDEAYFKYYFKYQLAPVIMGFKPSTTLSITQNRGISYQWKIYHKKALQELGLEIISLRKCNDKEVFLIYKNCLIQNVLEDSANKEFLEEIGYKIESVNSVLNSLIKRYTEVHCPHELGIFLGIPIDDVRDFVSDTKKECLTCGYWKVYNNLQEAQCIFKNYDQAKQKILDMVLGELEEAS